MSSTEPKAPYLEDDSASNEHTTPAEALRAQRVRGFRNLRFRGGLEGAFRRYLCETGREARCAILLMSLLLVAIMPWYIQFLHPPAAFVTYAFWLKCAQLPGLCLAAAVAWFRPCSRWADRLIIVAFVIVVASTLTQRVLGSMYGWDVPLEFVGIAVTALLVLTRTRFWYALPWALVATLAMVLVEWQLVRPPANTYNRLIAMIMLVTMASVGGYSIEYFIRHTWINSRLLYYLSSRDGLTGLLNRTALENATNRIIAYARRERRAFAIAMVDIDYFKDYNDSCGHRQGDMVLRRVSAMLSDAARRPQDFCGRYGGEEFVLVWVDGEYDELVALAQRLCTHIEQAHIDHATSPVSEWVTISVGLYWVDPDKIGAGADAAPGGDRELVAQLLDAADERLYKAKSGGRNRVVCGR